MKEAVILISITAMAFVLPLILGVWFFGLRPFIARNGRGRVTAVSWFFSMWADWTIACEIGKETGRPSWAARLFLALWLLCLALVGILLLLATG